MVQKNISWFNKMVEKNKTNTNMNWTESNNKLSASFKFKDFMEAFAFMTEVAMHAEKQNHHPNWSNVYNTVTIDLMTHDAGNVVTDKDRKLAETIDNIVGKYTK